MFFRENGITYNGDKNFAFRHARNQGTIFLQKIMVMLSIAILKHYHLTKLFFEATKSQISQCTTTILIDYSKHIFQSMHCELFRKVKKKVDFRFHKNISETIFRLRAVFQQAGKWQATGAHLYAIPQPLAFFMHVYIIFCICQRNFTKF